WGHEDTDLFIRLLKYGLKRIDNKFMALSYHLYHPKENTNRAEANKLLAMNNEYMTSYYCTNGIDKYLAKK
ncbi:MAG: glycosyl transferase, partial [Bacteroidales bacterium]|nr:glycosyl transferase [Bacteroidales bacterium]